MARRVMDIGRGSSKNREQQNTKSQDLLWFWILVFGVFTKGWSLHSARTHEIADAQDKDRQRRDRHGYHGVSGCVRASDWKAVYRPFFSRPRRGRGHARMQLSP